MSDQAKTPVLTICIVSYNTEALTIQTIKSVIADLQRSPDLLESHQIIVVDNNSSDNSVPAINRLAQKNSDINLKVIANNKNVGFAAANNQAIKETSGEFILLLNSDTLVQAGALSRMVFSMQNFSPGDTVVATEASSSVESSKLGIIAATLINWDGTHQAQGGNLPSLLTLAIQQFFIDDLPLIGQFLPSVQKTGRSAKKVNLNNFTQDQQLIPTGWVGGTAMLIRRSMIEEIGDLDENIFMYAEDMEFCLRAKNHHWNIAIHPTARITHFQNASSSSKNAIIGEIKGILYIWSKHKPPEQYQVARTILRIGSALRLNLYRLGTDQNKITAYEELVNYLKINKHA